ncbi:MAG: glycosyltransferase [Acidobacteriota bacterium]
MRPRLSMVVPVKDEADNVEELAAEISKVFSAVDYPWEVVWVDDGSTDQTLACLQGLPAPHRWLTFEANRGQSAALVAGIEAARGEWIGTMDGDGQNDPADLPRQLEHAEATGVDMVNGIRATRRDTWVRKLSSKIANGVRRRAVGDRVSDIGCSTRVVRRRAVERLPFFNGLHRWLPVLVQMRGFTMDEVAVNHRPRLAGTSKYGIGNRLWVGIHDIIGVNWLRARHREWRVVGQGGRDTEAPVSDRDAT